MAVCSASRPAVRMTGPYIIRTQVYGRLYLKKGMSFSLHKRAFPKAFDAIRQRAAWSLRPPFLKWSEFWGFYDRNQDGVHAATVYFRSAAGCTPTTGN